MENEAIINEFLNSMQTCFKNDFLANDVSFTYNYKHNNPSKKLISVSALVSYNQYNIVYEYTPVVFSGQIYSLLDLRLIFDKSIENPVEYTFYELLDFIDRENFKCYTIPAIRNPEMMNRAVKYLYTEMSGYHKSINEFINSDNGLYNLGKNYWSNFNAYSGKNFSEEIDFETYRKENFETWIYNLYKQALRIKFSSNPYLHLHRRQYDKFIKQSGKIKFKIPYENRLLQMIQNGVNEDFEILPSGLSEGIVVFEKNKVSIKELFAIGVSVLLISPLMFAAYAALFYLIGFAASGDMVYVASTHIGFMFLPAFITAIAASFFTRRKAYKLFFGKNVNVQLEIDLLVNTKSQYNFMRKFLNLVVIISIIFTFLTAHWNIGFSDSGILDNSGFFSIRGEFIPYSEVSGIYKVAARINGYNERVDYPSYIFLLKDGRQIDLYEFSEVEDIEENILSFLTGKGLEVLSADLPEDISNVQ